MKRVITYGTYDLFHEGHRRLLERAKALGDYLIVGVTTENYDESRGKLNVQQSLMTRIENVRNSGLADEIIIEEYEGQKINDIQKYHVDVFAIGSDWLGKFDYLNEFCDVVYLERTRGVSSTELRNSSNGIIKVGVVGSGRIANRFVKEARYVSGVTVEGVYGRTEQHLKEFVSQYELNFYATDYAEFLQRVDAVYIATPHKTHYALAKQALLQGKHVLCEKPAALSASELSELFSLAKEKSLVFLEAIKTAYAPGFNRMIALAKSGAIGHIVNVDATFTKLYKEKTSREFDANEFGGSVTELASYPLLAITKLLGTAVQSSHTVSYFEDGCDVDLFTKMTFQFEKSVATLNVGLGAKKEGDLVVTGTKGYIYVPAPWWLTEYFEVRFEDVAKNSKYFYKFEGDGLRYELAEFLAMINKKIFTSHRLSMNESLHIASVLEKYLSAENVIKIKL